MQVCIFLGVAASLHTHTSEACRSRSQAALARALRAQEAKLLAVDLLKPPGARARGDALPAFILLLLQALPAQATGIQMLDLACPVKVSPLTRCAVRPCKACI